MIDQYEACQRLLLHEGMRLQAYRCPAGRLTIGIGRNLEANPLTKEEGKVAGDWQHGITRECAFYLLRHDIERIEKELRAKISFWNRLDDERQYALLDMAFNLGVSGLLKFKKMLAWLWIGDWAQAALECLDSRYARTNIRRAKRIAFLLKTGKWCVNV